MSVYVWLFTLICVCMVWCCGFGFGQFVSLCVCVFNLLWLNALHSGLVLLVWQFGLCVWCCLVCVLLSLGLRCLVIVCFYCVVSEFGCLFVLVAWLFCWFYLLFDGLVRGWCLVWLNLVMEFWWFRFESFLVGWVWFGLLFWFWFCLVVVGFGGLMFDLLNYGLGWFAVLVGCGFRFGIRQNRCGIAFSGFSLFSCVLTVYCFVG